MPVLFDQPTFGHFLLVKHFLHSNLTFINGPLKTLCTIGFGLVSLDFGSFQTKTYGTWFTFLTSEFACTVPHLSE